MYSHTQVGWITLIILIGVQVAIGITAKDISPGSEGMGGVTIAMALFALLVPLFGWLTVTVDEEAVTAKFGIGLIQKKIKIKDIQSATQVRNKWYHGWGIRMLETGWMYNVSGLDAVDIAMINGGTFRIGTDEAEELIQAIRQRTSYSDK